MADLPPKENLQTSDTRRTIRYRHADPDSSAPRAAANRVVLSLTRLRGSQLIDPKIIDPCPLTFTDDIDMAMDGEPISGRMVNLADLPRSRLPFHEVTYHPSAKERQHALHQATDLPHTRESPLASNTSNILT